MKLTEQLVEEAFPKDIAGHQLAIKHDEGLYRHLICKNPQLGYVSWFEIVTWPGALAINGDMGSFTFARTNDMFNFFGKDRINPHYWQQKVTAGRENIKEYSQNVFLEFVENTFADWQKQDDCDAECDLWTALQEQVIDHHGTHTNDGAHKALAKFSFDDYEFSDSWEVDLRDYTYQFIWCCYAITWAIDNYRAVQSHQISDLTIEGNQNEHQL